MHEKKLQRANESQDIFTFAELKAEKPAPPLMLAVAPVTRMVPCDWSIVKIKGSDWSIIRVNSKDSPPPSES